MLTLLPLSLQIAMVAYQLDGLSFESRLMTRKSDSPERVDGAVVFGRRAAPLGHGGQDPPGPEHLDI